MAKKSVDTIILDLDNTIFDWFAVWYAQFEPIYREIIRATGRPAAEIEPDRAISSSTATFPGPIRSPHARSILIFRRSPDFPDSPDGGFFFGMTGYPNTPDGLDQSGTAAAEPVN